MADTYEFVHTNLEQAAGKKQGSKTKNISKGHYFWRWYHLIARIKLGLGWTGPFKIADKFIDVT